MRPARPDGASVVVAVATYRRPEMLAELLPVLTAEAAALSPPGRVVVVDNDPDRSAEKVAAGWDPTEVEYVAEPRPGIAAARNRALDACAGADAVVFIDDDETPRQGWLAALTEAWRQWGCAAVAGPVLSRVGPEADRWVLESGAFSRRRLETGAVLDNAATNNLLLDLAALRGRGLRFDDAFGLTGGSDTLLTRTLSRDGGAIRWCDTAEVTETVPPDRATRAWVLRRKRRSGNVWSRVRLQLAPAGLPRARARASLTLRGVFRVVRGTTQALAGRLTGNVGLRATGECDVATGLGVLSGAYGHRVVEYRRDG